MRKTVALVALLTLGLGGCAGESSDDVRTVQQAPPGGDRRTEADSPEAAEACRNHGTPYAGANAVLRAAYHASGRALEHWQLTRFKPDGPAAVSDFVQRHRAEPRMYICYFDDGETNYPLRDDGPQPNRVIVLVSPTGDAIDDIAGWHDTPSRGPGKGELKIERPTEPPPG